MQQEAETDIWCPVSDQATVVFARQGGLALDDLAAVTADSSAKACLATPP